MTGRSAGPIRRRLQRGLGRALHATLPGSAPKPASVAHAVADLPSLVGGPHVRHDPALDPSPSVVVLMPHLSVERMSGGPNTVFQITERLAARGRAVRYAACFGPLDSDLTGLRRHLRELTGFDTPATTQFLDCSGPGAELAVGRSDLVLATWWPTAYVAQRALAETDLAEFVYLIQDYEPGFHPWSTKFALAAATYDMPFRAIVNEPTLLAYLLEQGHLAHAGGDPDRAIAFMPAVDRALFRAREHRPGAPRLVFYARPKHPRNLFELGLQALAQAVERGAFDAEPWEFVSIGEETRAWTLAKGRTLEPHPRMSYADYGAFLGGSDLLLALMLSPHTSYPPLEMATAGGLVITNTFGTKTAGALAGIAPAIRGVPPDLDSLVTALAQAAGDQSAGHMFEQGTTLPATWDESLEQVIAWLDTTAGAAQRGLDS